MNNLTITIKNIPDRIIEAAWKSSLNPPQKQVNKEYLVGIERVDKIEIDYSQIEKFSPKTVIEVIVNSITLEVIKTYAERTKLDEKK